MTCALTPCEEMDRSTCPLSGGCVAITFAEQIAVIKRQRKPKTLAEVEGLKANAVAEPGKPKTRKKKR